MPRCPYCRRELIDLGPMRLFRLSACDARQHGPYPLVFQINPNTGAAAGEIKSQAAGVMAARILTLLGELRQMEEAAV